MFKSNRLKIASANHCSEVEDVKIIGKVIKIQNEYSKLLSSDDVLGSIDVLDSADRVLAQPNLSPAAELILMKTSSLSLKQ